VRIRSIAGDVDMTAVIEDLSINTTIDSRAFDVTVPPDAIPMTLDDLRSVVPCGHRPEWRHA
jgi:outer membrane lipoprotein-sorting protein